MTIRSLFARMSIAVVTFLLPGCLNVAETLPVKNKPHEGMSFRCDGYEPK